MIEPMADFATCVWSLGGGKFKYPMCSCGSWSGTSSVYAVDG